MEELFQTIQELILLVDIPDTIILLIVSVLNVILTFVKTSKSRICKLVKPEPINTGDYVAVVGDREIRVDDLHIKKISK